MGQCITGFPNTQDFESTNGGWTTGGTASDWAWGKPAKSVIKTAASGTKCWISGGLNNSSYNDGELGWVKSPCYDFTNLKYPTVGFYAYWETEYNYDGTVLQYSIDNGTNWSNVGSYSDAKNCFNLNWFNTSSIKYQNNDNGWSGSSVSGGGCGSGNGSNKWTLCSHTMPYLAGYPNVQFRFLFGAGTACNDYDGFAFDYFTVGNALPNFAAFTYTCTSSNTVSFKNGSPFCPTYQWDFGDPGSGASNSSTATNPGHVFSGPGQYSVKLTATGPDNAPSSITQKITITDLKTQVMSNALCNGDKNGAAFVTATPVVAGLVYNYSWNTAPAQNSDTVTGLGQGNYTVTVSGASVCTNQANITILEPVVLSSTIITDQPTCNGNDGKITLGTTGGTAPYTYGWTPSISSTNVAAGLSAGGYDVVVTDKNQCTETRSFLLTAPSAIAASISNSQDVVCYGNKNGTATVTVSGGTGPYTYSWAPYGGNNATAVFLGGNTYTVTIKDQGGCSTTATAMIAEPAVLTSTISNTDALCANNNGTASATITGGVLPYSYSWAPGGYNTANITGLAPQNYNLTVTDKNGCKVSDATTIKATSTALNVQVNSTDVKCFGDKTGTASVVITGGTAPFVISWSNGAAGATASGLGKGSYTVTVKDASNCSSSGSVTIKEPPTGLSLSLTGKDAVCNNGKGSIQSVTSGGTPAYQYLWSPGGAVAQDFNNVNAGTYNLLLTDINGCNVSAAYIVKEPAALALNIAAQSTSCGNNNGSASANVTGGTAPYTYTWTPGNLNVPGISNLAPGKYALTVTDKNKCTQNGTADILSTSVMSLQVNHANVKCFGDKTGSASVNITGGVQPYAIIWSNGASGALASNLAKGNYTVTVNDAFNCSNTASVTITEPGAAALTVSLKGVEPLCNNGKGSITSTVNNGTPGYQYLWSPGNATSADLKNVNPGSYHLSLTDNNGCETAADYTLLEPAALAVNLTRQNTSCGNPNGTASASVTGGTMPYAFTWTPANGNTSTLNNLAAGTYALLVTDQHGCTQNASADIAPSTAMSLQTSHTDISCSGDQDGKASVNITGGVPPLTIAWSNGANTASVSGLAKGSYTVTVKDAGGCSISGSVTVAQPAAALNIVVNTVDALCYKGSGSISCNVSGGTPGYNYAWSAGGISGPSAIGLPAGSYSVTVTDNKGCNATANALIKEPAAITTTLTVQNTTCGNNDGSITAAVAGGSLPYSYAWMPGNLSTAVIKNLANGKYILAITDKNGCIAKDTATVVSPGNLLVQTSSKNVSCYGDKNGTAAVIVSGGSPAYTVSWSNGMSTPSISNLGAGTYSVTVKDGAGCSASNTIVVTEPAALITLLNSSPAVCNSNDGKINSTTKGGVLPYVYAWQPGNTTTPNIVNAYPGNYVLTVTDKNGCIKTAATVVEKTNPLTISLGKDTSVCGSDHIVLSPGGFANYLWQDNSTGASLNVSQAGHYWVTVKDQRGCIAADSITIVNDCGEIWFPTAFTPNNDGHNDKFGPLGNLSLIGEFSMTVFNRWGEKVFESYNAANRWDGKYKGQMMAGTYVWFARYNGHSGVATRKGTIVLVR
jgi:gliding motility-associated-like protein